MDKTSQYTDVSKAVVVMLIIKTSADHCLDLSHTETP